MNGAGLCAGGRGFVQAEDQVGPRAGMRWPLPAAFNCNRHCFCHFIGHGCVTHGRHLWSLIHFYDAMYRRTPASTGIHDLDTLEARGAAFVTTQQQPRPRRRRSSAPIARANESHSCSQLSGLSIFGVSAYGIILIATALALVAVLVVFIYLVTSISAHYVSR